VRAEIVVALLLASFGAAASENIKLGTFSPEDSQGIAFELKKDGVAVVLTGIVEDEGMGAEKPKRTTGSWRVTDSGIEISFSKFHDRFKLEKECVESRDYYCFRHEKSPGGDGTGSPLSVDYPFMNWSWKNGISPHSVTQECIDECKKVAASGEMKKGLDVNSCARAACK
jgi:hypothetical protein